MGSDKQRQAGRTSQTRVVVIDDHPMVREHLKQMLRSEPDLCVCGEADTRTEGLEIITATKPDLAIVDLSLKESHGLDLIKDLQISSPRLPILVVSMHDESLYAERAIRAGARGYITKQEATKKILLAIRRVLAGEVYLSESLTSKVLTKLMASQTAQAPSAIETLTDRELQVFRLIGLGHTTRQIADELGLDGKTVETYRSRIKEKLELKDAADLLQRAILWIHSGDSL
jgi:DNA-binding NarL/FixJ family response regulator